MQNGLIKLPGRGKFYQALTFLALLALYASLQVQPIELPDGGDLPRLIKNGETLFATPDVLSKNLYSYTEPDHPFANHHWLSSVLLYFLARTVGFSGIVVFKVVMLLAAFTLLFITAMKKVNFWLVAIFSLPTIIILADRTEARPEIFSYLFIAVFLYALTAFEKQPEQKRVFWLIPAQILWTNVHLYFAIGPLLVAGFLIEKIYKQRRHLHGNPIVLKTALLLGGVLTACFINPFGMAGAIRSLKLNLTHDFPILISEMDSVAAWLKIVPLSDNLSLLIYLPTALILYISFIVAWQQKPIFYFLASVGSAVLGYTYVRAMPLFGLIFLPAVTVNLNGAFEKVGTWLRIKLPLHENSLGQAAGLLFVSIFTLVMIVTFRGNEYANMGFGLAARSNDSAMFFKNEGLRGPIFNDTVTGSYLIYHLYPAERVFVDNRFGDAYSAPFFRDEYQAALNSEERWQEILQQYNFNVLFFSHYDVRHYASEFLTRRMRDPSWALIYGDYYNVILLKNSPENQAKIERLQITSENAASSLNHLAASLAAEDQIAAADIYYLLGREDLAMAAYKKVVAQWPDIGKIWLIMGDIESKKNDLQSAQAAIAYFENAINAGRNTAEVYSFLGSAYHRAGQHQNAQAAWQKALKLNPEQADAADGLQQLSGANNGSGL